MERPNPEDYADPIAYTVMLNAYLRETAEFRASNPDPIVYQLQH